MFMVALFTIPQSGARIPFEGSRSAGYMGTYIQHSAVITFLIPGTAAAEFATFVVLGIVFVVLLWKNRIFTESFWEPITMFFYWGRRSKIVEVVEAPEIYSKKDHTKRLRRPAADIYRQVRHRRMEDTDLESVLSSETGFVNAFQSNADKVLL